MKHIMIFSFLVLGGMFALVRKYCRDFGGEYIHYTLFGGFDDIRN